MQYIQEAGIVVSIRLDGDAVDPLRDVVMRKWPAGICVPSSQGCRISTSRSGGHGIDAYWEIGQARPDSTATMVIAAQVERRHGQ